MYSSAESTLLFIPLANRPLRQMRKWDFMTSSIAHHVGLVIRFLDLLQPDHVVPIDLISGYRFQRKVAIEWRFRRDETKFTGKHTDPGQCSFQL